MQVVAGVSKWTTNGCLVEGKQREMEEEGRTPEQQWEAAAEILRCSS